MAEEGIVVEGEGSGSSMSPGIQAQKSEEKARAKGWRPLDEFKGDVADWVDHKEFLGREKLFDKIHDLKNQLSRQAQKFEGDMTRISAHFAKVQETEYKKAKRDLESQLAAAKQAGEVDAVAEIAGQIKEVEADAKAAAREVRQTSSGGPTPEYLDWKKENGWFEKDAEMTADAIAIGTGYAQANPKKSQNEILEYTSKKIKKMYPENFEDGEPTERKRVSDNKVEGGSGGSRSTSKKKGLSVSDLDETQLTVMRSIVKRGALKDIAAKNKRTQQEEYLVQLAERLDA